MTQFNINEIKGLTLFTPELYKDERGHNFESYDSLKFKEEISSDKYLSFFSNFSTIGIFELQFLSIKEKTL